MYALKDSHSWGETPLRNGVGWVTDQKTSLPVPQLRPPERRSLEPTSTAQARVRAEGASSTPRLPETGACVPRAFQAWFSLRFQIISDSENLPYGGGDPVTGHF